MILRWGEPYKWGIVRFFKLAMNINKRLFAFLLIFLCSYAIMLTIIKMKDFCMVMIFEIPDKFYQYLGKISRN